MSNLRIAIVNHWDTDTTITVADSATGMPAGNTQKTARGLKWRSAGGTPLADHTLQMELSTTRAANMLAIFGHNLAGGTVRLKLYSDTGATAQVYDSTALAVPAADDLTAGSNYGMVGTTTNDADDLFGNDQPYVLYFTATAFKAAIITVSAGTLATADGYLQVGRVWLAMYKVPGRSADFGAQLSWQTNTQSSRTRGGSLRSNTGEVWRRLELDLSGIAPSERSFWNDVQHYSQESKDLFISVFPGAGGRDERDYQMDGQVVAMNPLIYEYNRRKTHLVIEEL